jgi:hypothetical protein
MIADIPQGCGSNYGRKKRRSLEWSYDASLGSTLPIRNLCPLGLLHNTNEGSYIYKIIPSIGDMEGGSGRLWVWEVFWQSRIMKGGCWQLAMGHLLVDQERQGP